MIHARITLMLGLVLATSASLARGQDTDRDEMACSLLQAEALRHSLRIDFEPKFIAGSQPSAGLRTIVTRLTDGQGRFRQETRRPSSRESGPVVQVDTWDGSEARQEFYFADRAKTARHNVVITDQRPQIDELDEIGPSLGLRCWHSEKSVGELLMDPAINAEVRSTSLKGLPVVEIKIIGPDFAPSAILVFQYDPQRQWILLERETFAHSIEEGKTLAEGTLHFHSKITASDFHEVGGVWMPGRFDNYTTLRPNTAEAEKYHLVTLVRQIELNPSWTDADFTVDLASLPLHSQIADARWGGTYRLGEDVVLLSGRLYQLPRAIEAPIDPAHHAELTIGATPIVDPSLLAGGSWLRGRSLSDWLRLAGYLMVAGGAVGAVVLFFRHRFNGS